MTIEKTLEERGNRYGEFKDLADISQTLKSEMHSTFGWIKLSKDKREALEMIAQKIARILNGDAEYADNWHDIAGYATLAEKMCKK